MFLFYYFLIVFVISLFILFLIYIFLIFGYLRTGVPFVSLTKENQNKILKLMNLKEGETLVDLGCGDATFLIEAEKKYRVRTIGYELSPTAFLISKINIFFKKSKTKVFLKDFFKAELSEADVIFCYLFPPVMKKVSEKLKKELKPKARIFSLDFPLPDWPNEKTFYLNRNEKVYIYEK
ncbi:MAG: SAM-dependent methyltransferase [Patescibacteria group bacterium]